MALPTAQVKYFECFKYIFIQEKKYPTKWANLTKNKRIETYIILCFHQSCDQTKKS